MSIISIRSLQCVQLSIRLKGLKENVIVGRLIPAGTGYSHHQESRRRRSEETMQVADAEQELSSQLSEVAAQEQQ